MGGTVEVKPILLLPGWDVETEQPGKVSVLNPKQVRTFLKGVEDYDEVISERLINRICRHVAEKAGYPEPMNKPAEVTGDQLEGTPIAGTHPAFDTGQ